MADELAHVADRLEALAEELADLAIARLRDALHDKEAGGRRPADEKRITQARRSVERAVHLLRTPADAGDDL